MQKAVVVYFLTEKRNNLEEINQLLSDGWKVISQKPMSGGNQSNASTSLVILEK